MWSPLLQVLLPAKGYTVSATQFFLAAEGIDKSMAAIGSSYVCAQAIAVLYPPIQSNQEDGLQLFIASEIRHGYQALNILDVREPQIYKWSNTRCMDLAGNLEKIFTQSRMEYTN